MKTKNKTIEAAAPNGKNVVIQAEAVSRNESNFTGVAYSGGQFWQPWSECPVVVDLLGLTVSPQIPLLYSHYNAPNYRLGTMSVKNDGKKLSVSGSIDNETQLGAGIVSSGKKYDWQLSIGTGPAEQLEAIDANATVEVNGQKFTGPVNVVRKCELREVSVVAVGADNNTHMRIAAGFINNSQQIEGGHMKQELRNFIIARYGLANGADDAAVRAHLESIQRTEAQEQADFDSQPRVKANGGGSPEPGGDNPPKTPQVTATAGGAIGGGETDPAVLAAVNAALQRRDEQENTRITAINAAFGTEFPELRARALSEHWTADKAKTELVAALRKDRPSAGAFNIINRGSEGANPGQVLQAAAMLSGGIAGEEVIRAMSAPVVDAASQRFRSGISLQQMILEAAWANGCTERYITQGNWIDVTAAACGRGVSAGFTSVSLPGIFSNVANKFLLDGFAYVGQSWREIAAVNSVNDFKEVTRYRLGADFKFQKVGQGGELKHGSLSETGFKNAADTYGLMIGITRQDIINDDLGALTRIPNEIGIAAGTSFNEIFWVEFMDNGTLFKAANGNLLPGNPLGVDGLTAAVKMFRLLKDETKKLIGAKPTKLLVGPSNEVTADKLFNGTQLIATGVGSTAQVITDNNPHAKKYQPVVSPYLEDSGIDGNSATAWYLLADPKFRAAVEAVFLNGVQTPKIESSASEFNTLGIQLRGYMDFGVRKQDPKAGIKVTGVSE